MLLGVVSLVLALALMFGAGVLGYFIHKWTKGEKAEVPAADPPAADAPAGTGGMAIPENTEQNEIKLMSMTIPVAMYETYGVSPAAETAYTVTATVTSSAEDSSLTEDQNKVTWSYNFKDESDWASGKDLSEYVTFSVTGNQVLVTCLKPFGKQIVLTVTSAYNTAKSASLTIDYKEKIEFTGVQLDSKAVTGTIIETLNITGDRDATVTGQFTRSDAYTIKGDVVKVTVKISRSEDLKSALASEYQSRVPEYSAPITSDSPTATINDFLDKETHKKIFLDGYPTPFIEMKLTAVYNALNTMNTSSKPHYTVTAETGSEGAKTLGQIRLNHAEIKTWYETFTGITVSVDHSSGIIF